jgi:glycine oxidase
VITYHKDYLLVGQGLSGSNLAWQLHFNNLTFDIIDNGGLTSSSRVAGGVVNPMSFKRLILSWKAQELVTYAQSFYSKIEAELGQKVYHPFSLLRPFSSFEEQNNWAVRMAEPSFTKVLDFFEETLPESIHQEFGIGKVNLAGRLDVEVFLDTTAHYFKSDIFNEQFDYSLLQLNDTHISYKDNHYKGLIFCDGYQYIHNPYFSYLPQNCTKGEILIIKSNQFPNQLISKGCFVMPFTKPNHFVVGATYKWDDLTTHQTDEAKSELLEKLEKIGDFDYEIMEHKVGIRPTVPDRRPLIGTHPTFKNVHLFNGMGSKAVMLAPHFSANFLSYLNNEAQLEKEVDIKRYIKYFS